MAAPISPISPVSIQPIQLPVAAPRPSGASADAFQNILAEAVGRVENYRHTAETAVQRFMTGEDEELHKVAIATQQAEVSLELFLQVKNKVVQAYQEIMRMQI
jgi:flagellar hook-basal body complex protein FliE